MVQGKVGTAGLRGDSRSLQVEQIIKGVEVSRSAERMRPGAPVPPPEGTLPRGIVVFWICPSVTSAMKHSAPLFATAPNTLRAQAGFRSQNASSRGGKDQFAKHRLWVRFRRWAGLNTAVFRGALASNPAQSGKAVSLPACSGSTACL